MTPAMPSTLQGLRDRAILATRVYERRQMRAEDSPTFRVVY
jgi:hypothetical protein